MVFLSQDRKRHRWRLDHLCLILFGGKKKRAATLKTKKHRIRCVDCWKALAMWRLTWSRRTSTLLSWSTSHVIVCNRCDKISIEFGKFYVVHRAWCRFCRLTKVLLSANLVIICWESNVYELWNSWSCIDYLVNRKPIVLYHLIDWKYVLGC